MRRRTLWWTWWPSVHLHCEPQNHELKSHYREWGRDRDAGHLFAWTKLCGLLAGYICGRVDRICDIDPSHWGSAVLFLVISGCFSWALALLPLLASDFLCNSAVRKALWSMNTNPRWDSLAMVSGMRSIPKCYNIQLRCLGAGAALHDSGGDDFHHTEHLLAPQSAPDGGNISWSVCNKGAGATSCDHPASGIALQPAHQRTIFLIPQHESSCGLRQVVPPLVSPPGFSPPGWLFRMLWGQDTLDMFHKGSGVQKIRVQVSEW